MATKLSTITTQYRSFVNDQVLTADQLNTLIQYFGGSGPTVARLPERSWNRLWFPGQPHGQQGNHCQPRLRSYHRWRPDSIAATRSGGKHPNDRYRLD